MFDKFKDECGVFGVLNHKDASNLVYLGLYALQHRGQESAGIASVSRDARRSDANIGSSIGSSGAGEQIIAPGSPQIHCEKEMGHVAEIFTPERIGSLPGHMAIGHTRYSTAGDTVLLNAQPFAVSCNKGRVAVAHNGNITNAAELRKSLEKDGAIFQVSSDTEVILHLVAHSKERTLAAALRDALLQLEGAFSLVFLAEDRVIVARDPNGFRPLAFGQMELSGGRKAYVFASETCAFDLIDAIYMNDVRPGEMVIIGPEGVTRELWAPPNSRSTQCVFEHVYFARPDSLVFGRPVQQSRELLGRLLAIESTVDADVVVPVPDSGNAAALGYSSESGIPFRAALIRNHYVGRTFIEPSQAIRDFGVKLKLNPIRHLLEGRRVILVDDSIVRGTTSKKIVRMVRNAGAREVHLRISCPPTVAPCFYGVDTPSEGELIAANNTVDEIRRFVEADSLAYLSLEGLKNAVNDNNNYCHACYTGNYPTDLVNIAELRVDKARR